MGTVTWTDNDNTNVWSDDGNWTPDSGTPGASDDTILLAAGETPVIGRNDAFDVFTKRHARFGNPIAPTVTIDDGFFTTNGTNSFIAVGSIDDVSRLRLPQLTWQAVKREAFPTYAAALSAAKLLAARACRLLPANWPAVHKALQ
jgi:hypothetical protein